MASLDTSVSTCILSPPGNIDPPPPNVLGTFIIGGGWWGGLILGGADYTNRVGVCILKTRGVLKEPTGIWGLMNYSFLRGDSAGELGSHLGGKCGDFRVPDFGSLDCLE